MIRYRRQEHDKSRSSLKEMMTATPMSPQVHADIMRRRVAARRLLEDARQAARMREDNDLVAA